MQRALLVVSLLLAALSLPALAGRPLASDDASTADAATCQVELWSERVGPQRALVAAPACGIAPGLELDLAHTWLHPRAVVKAVAGLSLKWVPQALKLAIGAGELNAGVKLDWGWVRPAARPWQSAETGLLGLATLKASESFSLHGNLGLARDRDSGTRATLLNLALVWTPSEPLLLFAEAQANSNRTAFGGTVAAAGARWWLIKDTLGLDLTASRESGAGGPTRWTVGFGWYGIGS